MKDIDSFVVSLNSGAVIIDFNDTASKISGYSKQEVIGKNWFEIFIPNSNILEMLEVFNDLFYGKDLHWEYINDITCKDGTLKKLKWVNNIVTDNNKRPEFIRSIGIKI